MANSTSISLIKQKVKNEIVTDEMLVKAIGSPSYDPLDLDFSGEDVANNYIFTWNQNPTTIIETITFLTIQVHTYIYYSKKWVIPSLEIYIYSHNKHMKLNPKEFPGVVANRNDYISQLLDQKFNGRASLGNEDEIKLISELQLTENREGAFDENFVYRRMVFETRDLNDAICSYGW